jgi:hypothetical protein
MTARVTRSLIRSPAMGTGCGLFAFNFAPSASISVDVSGSVIGGGVIASGGVSRPDAVNDSRTVLASDHNPYRDDTGIRARHSASVGTCRAAPEPRFRFRTRGRRATHYAFTL